MYVIFCICGPQFVSTSFVIVLGDFLPRFSTWFEWHMHTESGFRHILLPCLQEWDFFLVRVLQTADMCARLLQSIIVHMHVFQADMSVGVQAHASAYVCIPFHSCMFICSIVQTYRCGCPRPGTQHRFSSINVNISRHTKSALSLVPDML